MSSDAELIEKFVVVTKRTIAEQAKTFLRQFIDEFSGKEGSIEEVLDLADEFGSYTENKNTKTNEELEQAEFHLFQEKRGDTMTFMEVREPMKKVGYEVDMKISFLEYVMFKYSKTVAELFEEKEFSDAALLAALDEAIAWHEEVLAARQEEDDKISSLEKASQLGGVKGARAKVELEQMRVRSQTGQNMAEVRSAFMKRQAMRNLKNGDPMAEEMKKLKLKQEEEERKKLEERKASQERLKAKAAFLNQA